MRETEGLGRKTKCGQQVTGTGTFFGVTQNTQVHVPETTELPEVCHSINTWALGGQQFLFVTVHISHLNIHISNHEAPALQAHSTLSSAWCEGSRLKRARVGLAQGPRDT